MFISSLYQLMYILEIFTLARQISGMTLLGLPVEVSNLIDNLYSCHM